MSQWCSATARTDAVGIIRRLFDGEGISAKIPQLADMVGDAQIVADLRSVDVR